MVLGAGGAEGIGPAGGIVVRLASVAAGFGVEGGPGLVACPESESTTVLCEQAPTVAAKPMLLASQSSRRRLMKSGYSSGPSGAGASMALTIRMQTSLAGCLYPFSALSFASGAL